MGNYLIFHYHNSQRIPSLPPSRRIRQICRGWLTSIEAILVVCLNLCTFLVFPWHTFAAKRFILWFIPISIYSFAVYRLELKDIHRHRAIDTHHRVVKEENKRRNNWCRMISIISKCSKWLGTFRFSRIFRNCFFKRKGKIKPQKAITCQLHNSQGSSINVIKIITSNSL